MKVLYNLLVLVILVIAACSQSEERNEKNDHPDLWGEIDTSITPELSDLPMDTQSDTIAGLPSRDETIATPTSAHKAPEESPVSTIKKVNATEKPSVKEEKIQEETPPVKPVEIKEIEPLKEEPVIKTDTEVSLSLSNSGNNISASGTSTLHDWTMAATSMTGNAKIKINDAGQLVSIDALSFSLPVLNLQSKDKKMDSNARDALKANQYSTMNFQLTKATITPTGNNKYSIRANGNLTVAGVTRGIILDATGVLNNNRSFSITGKKSFNMTDFEIKPPQFLMGTMKTGDQVTVDFHILLMP